MKIKIIFVALMVLPLTAWAQGMAESLRPQAAMVASPIASPMRISKGRSISARTLVAPTSVGTPSVPEVAISASINGVARDEDNILCHKGDVLTFGVVAVQPNVSLPAQWIVRIQQGNLRTPGVDVSFDVADQGSLTLDSATHYYLSVNTPGYHAEHVRVISAQ